MRLIVIYYAHVKTTTYRRKVGRTGKVRRSRIPRPGRNARSAINTSSRTDGCDAEANRHCTRGGTSHCPSAANALPERDLCIVATSSFVCPALFCRIMRAKLPLWAYRACDNCRFIFGRWHGCQIILLSDTADGDAVIFLICYNGRILVNITPLGNRWKAGGDTRWRSAKEGDRVMDTLLCFITVRENNRRSQCKPPIKP